jgi:hypothetical protein
MALRKALLALAVVLFVGWMAYLIHLALTHRHHEDSAHPTVLSRPQFLVSQVVVVAHFESEEEDLKDGLLIDRVLYPAKESESLKKGAKLNVLNLSQCAGNWSGPGDYLVPLQKAPGDAFIVTSIPRSPGFGLMRPLIYRWTTETEDQFNHLPKPEAAGSSGR